MTSRARLHQVEQIEEWKRSLTLEPFVLLGVPCVRRHDAEYRLRDTGVVAEVVRTPIGPDARLPTQRTLDERFYVRWPGAYTAASRTLSRLPPRSRLRCALLRRSALSGWGAWVSRDFELMLLRFAPDLQYEPPREWQAAGMRSVYRGHTGLREWTVDMREAWEWIENKPLELLDAGEVLVFRNRNPAAGPG